MGDQSISDVKCIRNSVQAKQEEEKNKPYFYEAIQNIQDLSDPNFEWSIWFLSFELSISIASLVRDVFRNTDTQDSLDDKMYGIFIANLDHKYINRLQGVIANPPKEKKYEDFKNKFLDLIKEDNEAKDRISKESMFPHGPSTYYNNLRSLKTSGVSDDFIFESWSKGLPLNLRSALAVFTKCNACKRNVEQLVELADDLYQLQKELDEIKDVPLCWYHLHYGIKAHRCTNPCGWDRNGY